MNAESFDSEEYIRQAEQEGDVAFVTAVAQVINRAEALRDTGDKAKVIRYLKAVAALDINDKSISSGVQTAREMLKIPDDLVWSDDDCS
jgi:hypothetical protein